MGGGWWQVQPHNFYFKRNHSNIDACLRIKYHDSSTSSIIYKNNKMALGGKCSALIRSRQGAAFYSENEHSNPSFSQDASSRPSLDRQMDGQMDGWTPGQMDGQTGRQADRQTSWRAESGGRSHGHGGSSTLSKEGGGVLKISATARSPGLSAAP